MHPGCVPMRMPIGENPSEGGGGHGGDNDGSLNRLSSVIYFPLFEALLVIAAVGKKKSVSIQSAFP